MSKIVNNNHPFNDKKKLKFKRPLIRKSNITKANPRETSEPATVKIYNEKICPIALSKIDEKLKKFKLQANKIISKNNRIIIIFLLLIRIPYKPKKKSNKLIFVKSKIYDVCILSIIAKSINNIKLNYINYGDR
jgi:hypothetical protein